MRALVLTVTCVVGALFACNTPVALPGLHIPGTHIGIPDIGLACELVGCDAQGAFGSPIPTGQYTNLSNQDIQTLTKEGELVGQLTFDCEGGCTVIDEDGWPVKDWTGQGWSTWSVGDTVTLGQTTWTLLRKSIGDFSAFMTFSVIDRPPLIGVVFEGETTVRLTHNGEVLTMEIEHDLSGFDPNGAFWQKQISEEITADGPVRRSLPREDCRTSICNN